MTLSTLRRRELLALLDAIPQELAKRCSGDQPTALDDLAAVMETAVAAYTFAAREWLDELAERGVRTLTEKDLV